MVNFSLNIILFVKELDDGDGWLLLLDSFFLFGVLSDLEVFEVSELLLFGGEFVFFFVVFFGLFCLFVKYFNMLIDFF